MAIEERVKIEMVEALAVAKECLAVAGIKNPEEQPIAVAILAVEVLRKYTYVKKC